MAQRTLALVLASFTVLTPAISIADSSHEASLEEPIAEDLGWALTGAGAVSLGGAGVLFGLGELRRSDLPSPDAARAMSHYRTGSQIMALAGLAAVATGLTLVLVYSPDGDAKYHASFGLDYAWLALDF